MNYTRGITVAFVALFLSGVFAPAGAFSAPQEETAEQAHPLEFQKGMCYVTWDKDRLSSAASDNSIDALAATGTEWVALVVTWYQEKPYTTSISATGKTPSDASLIHAIEYMHSRGLKVMLKPHVDLLESQGGSWRGEISCPDDVAWDAWFTSYGEFVMHYAKIAEEAHADMYCVGTELSCVTMAKSDFWRERIIKPVRQVYKGPLTYAANWNEEFQYVKFWDLLDYVGIDAYFPLTDAEMPTKDEIRAGWEKWVKELTEFQAKVNKPVIFPEVGYCSADGTARTPWEEKVSGKPNMELQETCYEVLYELFWDKPWFYGAYWWKWGTDVRFGGPSNKGFSPQNKPAQNVIKKWYATDVPPKSVAPVAEAAPAQ